MRPPPAWELMFVRLVNFAIFLLALAAFEFFLQQVTASHETAVADGRGRSPSLSIPRWMWRLAGSCRFVGVGLVRVDVWLYCLALT